MLLFDKRVHYLIHGYGLATIEQTFGPTYPPSQYGAPYRNVMLRRPNGGTNTRRRLLPDDHRIIPLEYHRGTRAKDGLKPGAIWYISSPTPGISGNYMLVSCDDETALMRQFNNSGDPGDLITVDVDTLHAHISTRRITNNSPHTHNSVVSNAVFCGSLPAMYQERLIDRRRLFMDENEQALVGHELTVDRGPRARVVVHRASFDDLDPPNTTVADIQGLHLEQIGNLSAQIGIDVIEQLDPDNTQHQTLAKLLAAWFKPDYLVTATNAEITRHLPGIGLSDLIRAVLNDIPVPVILPHGCEDHPGMVCFYSGIPDLIRGRPTPGKPGKVVRKVYPGDSDETVKIRANKLLSAVTPAVFEILTDHEAIIQAYKEGPSSCVAKPISQFMISSYLGAQSADPPHTDWDPRFHPAAVFGAPSDTGLAVMRKGEAIFARAVVNLATRKTPRIYQRESTTAADELMGWLTTQGYTRRDDALEGATLRRVHLPDGRLVRPYLDSRSPSVAITNDPDLIVVMPRGHDDGCAPGVLTPKARELFADAVRNPTPNFRPSTDYPDRFRIGLHMAGHSEACCNINQPDNTVNFYVCDCGEITESIRYVTTGDGVIHGGCRTCLGEDEFDRVMHTRDFERRLLIVGDHGQHSIQRIRVGGDAPLIRISEIAARRFFPTLNTEGNNASMTHYTLSTLLPDGAMDTLVTRNHTDARMPGDLLVLPEEIVFTADSQDHTWVGYCSYWITENDGSVKFYAEDPNIVRSACPGVLTPLLFPTTEGQEAIAA